MENKERIQGSGNVSKSSLLQQVRGSMVNIEKLTPDNIGKVADEELSYERAWEIFEAEGVDIDKVIVDPYLYCGHCYPCSIGRTNCCTDLKVLGVHVAQLCWQQ